MFEPWFEVRSQISIKLGLEAVEGKVFDRYPGLFYFKSVPDRSHDPIDFYIVPLHLKAGQEGSKRRIMAAQILGAAIAKMIKDFGKDADWVVGGDFQCRVGNERLSGANGTEHDRHQRG